MNVSTSNVSGSKIRTLSDVQGVRADVTPRFLSVRSVHRADGGGSRACVPASRCSPQSFSVAVAPPSSSRFVITPVQVQ
jgi:hypothetical protein